MLGRSGRPEDPPCPPLAGELAAGLASGDEDMSPVDLFGHKATKRKSLWPTVSKPVPHKRVVIFQRQIPFFTLG